MRHAHSLPTELKASVLRPVYHVHLIHAVYMVHTLSLWDDGARKRISEYLA